jgi:hypothetical protein
MIRKAVSGSSGSSSGSSGGNTGALIGSAIGSLIPGAAGSAITALGSGLDLSLSSGSKGGTEIVPTTTQQDDYSDYIRQINEANRRSQIAGLDKARINALTTLEGEKAGVAPAYYDKRNQAAAASDVNAMNFAKHMAARGIKGAAGAMPEIYRQAGLQGQIGALDRQEAANMADIERRKSGINTAYDYDVTRVNSDIDSQTMQALIDQYNRDREYQLQKGQLTGNLGNATTLQKQQMDAQNTGYYNPYAYAALNDDIMNQLSPYMGNLQAFINENPSSPLTPYAQNLRFQKVMGDPSLQQQYGDQYRTVSGMQAANQNQLSRLEIEAQEIMNSNIPETEKMKLELLRQQVATGRLGPARLQAEIDLIKRQTANIGASSGGTGSWGALTPNQTINIINEETNDLYNEVEKGDITKEKAMAAIEKYRNYPEIYNALMNEIAKVFPGQTMYLEPLGPFKPAS